MPHFAPRGGKPIHERSGRELVWFFVVVPNLLSIAIMAITLHFAVHHHDAFLWQDWLGVVWGIGLSLFLSAGLPATAWREWQHRREIAARRSSLQDAADSPNSNPGGRTRF